MKAQRLNHWSAREFRIWYFKIPTIYPLPTSLILVTEPTNHPVTHSLVKQNNYNQGVILKISLLVPLLGKPILSSLM